MGEVTQFYPTISDFDFFDPYSNVTDYSTTVMTPSVTTMMTTLPFCSARHLSVTNSSDDSGTIQELKYLTYGIIWPSICALGIVGNVLNLVVLNQPNMKGTAYIYMRGE